MADPMVADPITPNPNLTATEFDGLAIPPLDPAFFSDDLTLSDDFHFTFDDDDGEGFDFTFDDIYLPSDSEDFLNYGLESSKPDRIYSDPDSDYCNQTVSEPETCQVSGDQRSSGGEFVHSKSPESGCGSSVVAGFLNVPSPDSGGSIHECSLEGSDVPRVLKCSSPETETPNEEVSGPASSQGSGDCCSAKSEALNYPSPDSGNCARSVDSSPNSANKSVNVVVDQKIKLDGLNKNCLLKRKKENEDVNTELRTSKYRRSIPVDSADQSDSFNSTNDDEEKKKARLMRNRESAQLSRQRKKHYVEELEDKVRTMHSTIQDLNARISYVVAENASLRQQLSGGAMCPPSVPPPGMYPNPPMAPMGYPWMPCHPYVVKPQGSQVPLVPIPRLKPQQTVSAPKSKKVESKKIEGKTKKVASISFLGLLFFILLFGGLVPMVNVKYGGMRVAFPGGSDYTENKFYNQQHGRVVAVNGHMNDTNHNIGIGVSNEKFGAGKDFSGTSHCGGGHGGGPESNIEQESFIGSGNGSEPLLASLYVPRNDKLVKIDGNLIIHSVLASEKAMASHEDLGMKNSGETGLAVALNLRPAVSIPGVGRNGRHPRMYRSQTERQRALASGSADKRNLKSTAADGKLQQWFREGLAGPLLSSGMCTEVFQFDVSPAPGAIVPATASVTNISTQNRQNSTHFKGRNRRILHSLPIPLPGIADNNITNKHVGSSDSQKENSHRNNSLSSMVVSVLVDPREAGNGDGDGMIGPKSLSRIFVVVLLDSVKYVTYSCVLPLMGSTSHLVTT